MALRHRLTSKAPALARVVKQARTDWHFDHSEPVATPHGFTLRGSHHQASGAFEEAELAYSKPRIATCDVLVDVGANYGLYTGIGAAAGKQVIAVEPLPANLRMLYQNILDNDFDNVAVHPVALGASPGILTLFGSGTGASLIQGWAGATARTDVAVQTLDSILLGAQVLDRQLFIKVDVEGAELQVLDGAERTLAAPSVSWMVEVNFDHHHPSGRNPDFLAIFERFWAAGYAAFSIEAEREMTPADVQRWLKQDARDFGGHNFGFSRS